MLDIAPAATTNGIATYELSGEITIDQLERIEALVQEAEANNRAVTLDLRHVWRIERDAAFLIAHHACRPNNKVRIVGVPCGLLEWLRAVVG